MRLIPLTQNKFAIVDDGDYDWLMQWKWSARKLRNSCYAQRGHYVNGRRDIIVMHRQILGLVKGDGVFVDHINGNGLDNRRCNLRTCSNQQNHFNMRTTTGTSCYKGVCRVTRPQKNQWLAQISKGGKNHFLGYFHDDAEAAKAYDAKALELFGEFACLNFREVSDGG